MTTIHVRTEDRLKTEGIPFPVRTANGFTPAQEERLLKEESEALRRGKKYRSARQMHRAILGA